MSTHATQRPIDALPVDLTLGPVELIVRDLDRATGWYARNLGLVALTGEPGITRLGDGDAVVVTLREDASATAPGAEAGLYHVALLYPSRAELARAALRLATYRTPIQGASDHGTHEAIYLADADGNGLELAADRPRERWPRDFGYGGGPAPLDVADLLGAIDGESVHERVGPGLRVGHLHLHVGDIDAATGFYRDTLGFGMTANLGSAAFFAAGDYHHHLGVNVWRGRGVGSVSDHVVGLGSWSMRLPTAAEVRRVAARAEHAGADVLWTGGDSVEIIDPWGMRLVVATAGGDRVG